MRKFSLPLKLEVLSVAHGPNTRPADHVGDTWVVTDTYEELFVKVNNINEDGEGQRVKVGWGSKGQGRVGVRIGWSSDGGGVHVWVGPVFQRLW